MGHKLCITCSYLPLWIVIWWVKFLHFLIHYFYNIIFFISEVKKGATTRSQWSQLVKVAWPESAQAHYYRDPSKLQENQKSKSIKKCLYFIKSYLVILKTLFIINIYWLYWNSELWDNNLIVLFALLPLFLWAYWEIRTFCLLGPVAYNSTAAPFFSLNPCNIYLNT